EDQAELARAFAGGLPPEARFGVGWWSADAWGSPVLEDAAASASCRVEQRIELASHSLLIAQVRAVRVGSGSRPLVYAHGQFTGLADPASCSAA
ncbi:MAG TPA: flavin reductase family protein, partial [Phenylobacterium sp.]|nr:flavin reductase family protein [Phenylobacterium sp.]